MTASKNLTGGHLIDGKWIKAADPELHAVNPATGATLSPAVSEAGLDEVDRALSAAVDAQRLIAGRSAEERAELLERIATELEADSDAIRERAEAETALPAATRLVAELGRTTGQLRMFATVVRDGSWQDAVIDVGDPARAPAPKPDLRRMMRPLGPVVVFGASNFPLAFGVAGGDTASALAAGNAVVAKGHPNHPGTNELVAAAILRAIRHCEFPDGLFGLVQGKGVDVGAALVTHPSTAAVGFTGSLRGGRALYDLAAQRPRPIPVFAEMGSVNPLVIMPGAIAERSADIVSGLAGSITMGVGQFCTKPGLVLVLDEPEVELFETALAEALGAAAPGTMLSASLRDGFCAASDAFVKAGKAKQVLSGVTSAHAGISPRLYSCTSRAWRNHPELQEEAFGPAALIVRCVDVADLCRTLRHVQGTLTGSVHSAESDESEAVAEVTETLARIAGRVLANGFPTGVEVCDAMVHGGPYPATTAPGTTSVGSLSIVRYARPVSYQNMPDERLPPELQDANPLGLWRRVNGEPSRDPIAR